MRKVVLVTGGNRGIGLEICKQLAEKDYTVLLTARNMAIGRPLVNELRKQWKTIWFHQLDVTDETSIRDLCSYLDEACGQVDILINNAGIISDQDTNVEVVDPEVVRETMETNLYGPLRLAQVLIPRLKDSEDGRIINISSKMGQLSSMGTGNPAYRISKAALNALTLILSNELKDTGVKVNSVSPGWVKTDMGGANASKSIKAGADTAVWLATADNIPNGRFISERKEIPW